MNREADPTLPFEYCLWQAWLYFRKLSLYDIFKAQLYLTVRQVKSCFHLLPRVLSDQSRCRQL